VRPQRQRLWVAAWEASELQHLPFRYPGSPQFGPVETILLAALESKALAAGW